MTNLELIKQKVLTKERKFDLFYWADIFLNEYGMSFEEFKKLNFQTFYLLKDRIQKRYEEQTKSMKKGRKR